MRFEPGYNGTALERFVSRCQFDAGTGCVLWTGGTTQGRGHSAPYGSFWFDGRRWFAHRWSAKYIHGHEIEGLQVDHHCPNRLHPHTLCVEHVQPLTLHENRLLQTERRRFYVLITKGYEEPPPFDNSSGDIPFFEEPVWLREFKRHAR